MRDINAHGKREQRLQLVGELREAGMDAKRSALPRQDGVCMSKAPRWTSKMCVSRAAPRDLSRNRRRTVDLRVGVPDPIDRAVADEFLQGRLQIEYGIGVDGALERLGER